jgi:hypothetical protein
LARYLRDGFEVELIQVVGGQRFELAVGVGRGAGDEGIFEQAQDTGTGFVAGQGGEVGQAQGAERERAVLPTVAHEG